MIEILLAILIGSIWFLIYMVYRMMRILPRAAQEAAQPPRPSGLFLDTTLQEIKKDSARLLEGIRERREILGRVGEGEWQKKEKE